LNNRYLSIDRQLYAYIDKFLEAKSGRRPKTGRKVSRLHAKMACEKYARKQDGTLGRVHKTDSIQANSKRGSQSKLEYLLRNDDDVCSE
jgi:hypothetical protein